MTAPHLIDAAKWLDEEYVALSKLRPRGDDRQVIHGRLTALAQTAALFRGWAVTGVAPAHQRVPMADEDADRALKLVVCTVCSKTHDTGSLEEKYSVPICGHCLSDNDCKMTLGWRFETVDGELKIVVDQIGGGA